MMETVKYRETAHSLQKKKKSWRPNSNLTASRTDEQALTRLKEIYSLSSDNSYRLHIEAYC